MKIINAIVNNVDATLEVSEAIIENQVNNAKIVISFDETWEQFDKYVIFKDENLKTYKVAVINDEVIIPSELKSGFVEFQIYGQVLNNNILEKRQPTRICGFVVENSLSSDGLDVSIPSPTEWDNYIKQIENITNRIVSDEDNRVNNEKNRVLNENTRIENENSRLTTESKRISAESDRLKNEKTRVANETARIKNEKSRVDYFTDLKTKVDRGDFKGEKGDKGDKGDKGEKGDKGDCNFFTLDIDVATGHINMNKPETASDIDFRVNEIGHAEVEING